MTLEAQVPAPGSWFGHITHAYWSLAGARRGTAGAMADSALKKITSAGALRDSTPTPRPSSVCGRLTACTRKRPILSLGRWIDYVADTDSQAHAARICDTFGSALRLQHEICHKVGRLTQRNMLARPSCFKPAAARQPLAAARARAAPYMASGPGRMFSY